MSKLCSICNSVICCQEKNKSKVTQLVRGWRARIDPVKLRDGQTEEGTDQGRHHRLDREAPQRLLVAHHQQLAHLDGGLELLRLVAGSLQALQELLGLGAWRAGGEGQTGCKGWWWWRGGKGSGVRGRLTALTGSAADGPVKELRHAGSQGPEEVRREAPGFQQG